MSKATLIRRPNGYIDWLRMSDEASKAYILSEMKKYNSPTAFSRGSVASYAVMLKRGWTAELQIMRGWKPRIKWEKMGKEEGIKLMKKIASGYTNISLFIKEQAGIAQKAQAWNVYSEITADIPRITHSRARLLKMGSDERLSYCKELARRYNCRYEFNKSQRLVSGVLKEFGDNIYEETLREIFGEKNSYKKPSKDRVGFLKLCSEIDPGEPYLIQKVNQMVSYYVARMSFKQRDSFLSTIAMKFFNKRYLNEVWSVPIANLWTWDWRANEKDLKGFSMLLNLAAADGLNVPIRTQDNKTRLLMLQNLIGCTNPLMPETVGELFVKAGPLQENVTNLIDAMGIVGHKILLQTNLEDLLDTIDSCRTETDSAKKSQKRIIKKNIEKFIKEGDLPESFNEFKNPMLIAYKRHRELDGVPIKKRNVVWYFFDMYQDWWDDIDEGSIRKRNQLTHHYNTVPKVMPSCLTLELFQKITGRKKQMLETMIEEGVLPDDFFDKAPLEYTIHDDKWIIDNRCINFTRISNKSTRYATKMMCKELLKSNKSATLASYITHAQHLDEFLEASKIPSLLEFTIDHKNDFYDYIDNLDENGDYTKAAGLIKFVRKLYGTLDAPKKRKGLVAPNLSFPNTEYSVPKKPKDQNYPIMSDSEMQKLLDYLAEVRKMKPSKRIPTTATILQLIISRRPSETVDLELDCITWLGNSGDWLLKYWSSKQNATKKVSVSTLCGNRQDPFALKMRELVPELIEEMKELTSTLRSLAPEEIKNKVFIRYSHITSAAEPIIAETYSRIGAEWITIRKKLGINTKITMHNARHTMATRLLRTGGNYIQAAEALGDAVGTIKNSYSATVSRLETMSLPKGCLINSIESDVRKIMDTKYSSPGPISDDEAANSDKLHDVCGGNCGAGSKKMHACETFLMTKGGAGCKGCPSFYPTPKNLPFWTLELRSDYNNMQKSKNTPLYARNRLNYLRTENLVKTLKELDNG